MGPLMRVAAALALSLATPAHASSVDRWRPLIEEASARFGVPTSWITQVMRAESAGQTTRNGRPIRSRAGAMGLMQLMPVTWAEMRARLALGYNPDDPRDNILAGTAYLRLMYDRFGYPGLFAAYNAGPARYGQHLATGRPLPAETVAYVAAVSGPSPSVPAVWPPASTGSMPRPMLFVVQRESSRTVHSNAVEAPPPALFVTLSRAR